MRIARTLSSLAVATALLIPPLASASNVKVAVYDTASGNGSLYQRVTDGSIAPRVVEFSTLHDQTTGKPLSFDADYQKREWVALYAYSDSYQCATRRNLGACRPAKTR